MQKSFYDEHSFDWIENYAPHELRCVINSFLVRTIDRFPIRSLVLDIGCGAGRVMSYLAFKGMRCVGLDMSSASVRIMGEHTGKPGIVADNLRLPLMDGIADLVISDGVIHHTTNPFEAFVENGRVLKDGGVLYLAVYKSGGLYEFLYRYPGRFIRWALKHLLGKVFVHLSLIPLYYIIHKLRSKGKRTWRGAQNLFYDAFATPRVTFLSYGEIAGWAQNCGMKIVEYDPNPKENVYCFLLKKQGSAFWQERVRYVPVDFR